jgi:hypothetical protein
MRRLREGYYERSSAYSRLAAPYLRLPPGGLGTHHRLGRIVQPRGGPTSTSARGSGKLPPVANASALSHTAGNTAPGYTMVHRATPMLTHRSALVSARGCGAGLAGARHSMQSGTRQPSWSGRGPHPDAQIPRRSHKDSRGPHKCTGSTSNGCVGSAQG